MLIILIIIAILLLTIGSVFLHELGHIITAKKLGHEFHGFVFKWYGAVGAKIYYKNADDIWKIALAGLATTLFICLLCIPFINFILIYYLFVLNFWLFMINIIPIKGLDGYYIYKKFKG